MEADVAQSAVHLHGKEEVAGSSPAVSTIRNKLGLIYEVTQIRFAFVFKPFSFILIGYFQSRRKEKGAEILIICIMKSKIVD